MKNRLFITMVLMFFAIGKAQAYDLMGLSPSHHILYLNIYISVITFEYQARLYVPASVEVILESCTVSHPFLVWLRSDDNKMLSHS